MLKIKLRVYNARSKECNLCGATPDHLWKFGRVSVEIRAQHFCDCCMNLLDADGVQTIGQLPAEGAL